MNPSNSEVVSRQSTSIGQKSSRHDTDSDEEIVRQVRKKDKKKEKKTQKEHKEHKDHKQSKDKRRKEDNEKAGSPKNPTTAPAADEIVVACKAQPVPLSKVDFFASLAALESQKPAVGTIHTVGKKPEAEKKTGSWDCPKCSTTNLLNSHQCHKCKAMKRMTEYR